MCTFSCQHAFACDTMPLLPTWKTHSNGSESKSHVARHSSKQRGGGAYHCGTVVQPPQRNKQNKAQKSMGVMASLNSFASRAWRAAAAMAAWQNRLWRSKNEPRAALRGQRSGGWGVGMNSPPPFFFRCASISPHIHAHGTSACRRAGPLGIAVAPLADVV